MTHLVFGTSCANRGYRLFSVHVALHKIFALTVGSFGVVLSSSVMIFFIML